MMSAKIQLRQQSWRAIREHLLQNEVEQVAVVFAQRTSESALVLEEQHHLLLEPTDFSFQSAFHIELTDEAQARIIRTAAQTDTSIIEFHSHVGHDADPAFSHSDLAGFRDFVPHVWWRLRGKPYAAVVVTDVGIDALVWAASPDRPDPVAAVVVGGEVLEPSGLTIRERRQYGEQV